MTTDKFYNEQTEHFGVKTEIVRKHLGGSCPIIEAKMAARSTIESTEST
jgi:hypothetical protein